jgi:hypothetical protein
MYAQCIDPPALDPASANAQLLGFLALDFLPDWPSLTGPNLDRWVDQVVDYLSSRDVHYLDAPPTAQ